MRIYRRLKGHPGYEAVQALRGVGPVLAAVFVAEIGDVSRFANPQRVVFVGRTDPTDTASPTPTSSVVGSPSKAHDCCARAAVEAVSGAVRDPKIASVKARVGARRGRNMGRVTPPPDIC